MLGQCEGDGSGAGADVENAERLWFVFGPGEDGFDEELGFGAGDEGVSGDMQRETVEFLLAGEVL